MKYILIGKMIDEETGEPYTVDVLDESDEEIVLNDELGRTHNYYDVLKVYKELNND